MHASEHAALASKVLETNLAWPGGIEGVVSAHTNILTRIDTGSELTDYDAARNDVLAAKDFDAATLTSTVTTVAGAAACFCIWLQRFWRLWKSV